MTRNASQLGTPPLTQAGRQTWVQTERAAHEAWGHLTVKSPRAAALMHHLVAQMDSSAAVVASYATLAKISRMSLATVRRAVDDLKAGNWIQVVQVGGKGAANAFIVNSRVGWADARDKLHLASFSARVLADIDDQDESTISGPPLRRLPVLRHAGEGQLPTGPGGEPPSQPSIPGMEPDLPSIQAELEARGQQRLTLEGVDQTTGEIYESERIRLGLPEGAELPDPFKHEREVDQ